MESWTEVSTLPYDFYGGSAVVLGDEIHILGSYVSGNYTKHYKYSNGVWTSVSTLPYDFYSGSAVVLDDEIHILGSYSNGNSTKHYKYSNGSWTSVSTLPYGFYSGSAVVLDGEIHILGGGVSGNYTKHYKYSNSVWTSVSTLPYEFLTGSAVVLDSEIHILGGENDYTKHYKYSNSVWTSVSTLPYRFFTGSAVVLDGEIHILGGMIYPTEYYKYSNGSWSEVSTLPYRFFTGSAVVLDGEIHILGSNNNYTKHYKYGHYSINKVVYGDKTLIDLTSDTITEDKLAIGYTAHDCSGNSITGTRPKYFQKNSSKYYHIKNIGYNYKSSYLYKSIENFDLPIFKMLNETQIYLRNSGTNMMLVAKKDDLTESTITIGTVGANYKNDFYIKDVLFLDRSRCLIHYYSMNGSDTYTAQSARLITIKNDKTLVQSSAITIANATTASLICNARITRMLNTSDSFLLVQTRQTVSSGATILYASRAQANFTTGALAIPSSSAWVTVSANNVNTDINLDAMGYGGGFFYQNASGNASIFIWNGYYSGYKNSTTDNAGLVFYYGPPSYYNSSIVGKSSNGNILLYCGGSDPEFASYYYDPVTHYFKYKNTISYSGNYCPIMLNNDIIFDQNEEMLEQIENDGNVVKITKLIPDFDDYINENNTGPESDIFNGYYIYGD